MSGHVRVEVARKAAGCRTLVADARRSERAGRERVCHANRTAKGGKRVLYFFLAGSPAFTFLTPRTFLERFLRSLRSLREAFSTLAARPD